MRYRQATTLGTLLAIGLVSSTVDAGGLPTCRVRVVASAALEKPSNVAREVASWVDVRDFGCILVPSIAQADVLLELTKHTFTFMPDGTPEQTWWFVARRLGEPDSDQGIHRFILIARDLREGPRLVSERLPVIVMDVCQGRLPRTQVSEHGRK
jgi:hypothetical protein